jgi:hypothetical protein
MLRGARRFNIVSAPVLVLVAVAAPKALILARTKGLSALAAGAAALALAAEIALLAGGPLVGSVAPLAAIETALCLVVLVRVPRRRALFFGALALAMGALEPGLGVFPLGAAAGALVPPSKRSGRSWPYVAASLAALVLASAVEISHPEGLVWLEGAGRAARTIQKVVLYLGVLGIVHGADRPNRPEPDDDRRRALMVPALGGVLASLVWLALPPLGSLTASPLIVLLLAAAPLGVSRHRRRARAGDAAERHTSALARRTRGGRHGDGLRDPRPHRLRERHARPSTCCRSRTPWDG